MCMHMYTYIRACEGGRYCARLYISGLMLHTAFSPRKNFARPT